MRNGWRAAGPFAVVGATVFTAWFLVPRGLTALRSSLDWPMIHDAPLMHYIAARILDGAVPYRDIFDMNLPGTYALHVLALRLFGASDAAWRAFDLTFAVATGAVMAVFCGRRGLLAALAAPLLFVALHLGMGPFNSGQRDFVLCFFLVAGAACGLLALRHSDAWLPGLGLSFGAAVLIKPQSVLLGAAVLLVVLARLPPERRAPLRHVGVVALCGLAPGVAALGWLASAGGLVPLLEIQAGYVVPLYSTLMRVTTERLLSGVLEIGWSFGLVPILPLLLVWGRRTAPECLVVLAGTLYGVLHHVLQGKGWEYHAYPYLCFATLGTALAFGLDRRWRPIPFVIGGALLLGFASYRIGVRAEYHAGAARPRHEAWFERRERAVDHIVRTARDHLGPEDTVQILDTTEGALHAVYAGELRLATPYLYEFHFFHDTDRPFVQELRRDFIRRLNDRPPRLFIVSHDAWGLPSGYRRHRAFPELWRLLQSRYREVSRAYGFRILERQE